MIVSLQLKIRNDPNLYRYLRENSNWYKMLNRSPKNMTLLEQEMKERYRMTTKDKMNKLSDQLTLIRTFMDLLG